MYQRNKYKIFKIVAFLYFATFLISCKKVVEIGEPANTITTAQTFGSEATATQALLSIYNNLTTNGYSIGLAKGAITIYTGLSSDELAYFHSNQFIAQFQNNMLQSNNGIIRSQIWTPAYYAIYQCNAVIEGVGTSNAIPDATKAQLIGEAKFLRAFMNFYLTNLFGEIPLITNTNWQFNSLLARTPQGKVYDQIISDLMDAQNSLPADFSASGNLRIRANKLAAIAFLARVYLYSNNWVKAEENATSVMNNSFFQLSPNLNNVFLKASSETIFQLQVDDSREPYALTEPINFIPWSPSTGDPIYYLTPELLSAFESDDSRKTAWLSTTNYLGTSYYYPYKYKTSFGSAGNVSEYYIAFRLAEQYLIRAEARVQQNKITEAIADVNVIRARANLAPLQLSSTKEQVTVAIAQERRIELFAEWGHRWFDLKRTQQATNVLGLMKAGWSSNDELYPIPLSDLRANPNMTQNAGY